MFDLPSAWREFDGPLSVFSNIGVTGPEYAVQILFKLPGGYDISVIRNKMSFGHREGLFELALFQGNYFVNLKEYVPDGFLKRMSSDYQLLGWLEEDEVTKIVKFMMDKFNVTVSEDA